MTYRSRRLYATRRACPHDAYRYKGKKMFPLVSSICTVAWLGTTATCKESLYYLLASPKF
jgi:hypothetical protein